MRNFYLAASVLSADFSRLGEEVRDVLAAGADWIHFDIMDQHYVPNLTVGPLMCQAIKPHAQKNNISAIIDVHLMVEPVDALIPAFVAAGAHMITFHPEASKHIDRSLTMIRELQCKAGLALNPATPLEVLAYVLDKIDMVLVMSVNPGFGGQSFIPAIFDKLKRTRQLLDQYEQQSGRKILLQVDGGIKIDNIANAARAGADVFVVGSAIFEQENYANVIHALHAQLDHF